MTTDKPQGLSFAVLDALLEQALELEGSKRQQFLSELPVDQQAALAKLLQRTGTDVIGNLGGLGKFARGIAQKLDDDEQAEAGDWRLQQEIGSGGTGQVFYAERQTESGGGSDDESFVQRAAVKVLWSHRVRSQFRERFLRERRILASIDHPGLARFLDGGLLGDGRPWFAMEFVDGKNIVDVAADLPIAERLSLFVDIANTIDYAHQRLIVHRDIKPQNILVDAHGKPRILDFGIAGILGEIDQASLTQEQGTPLTLTYASPEQVSKGSVDVASDVYQLGLLLYEMLTGQKPYSLDDVSLQDAINIICNEAAPSPSAANRRLSTDIDAIVNKALRKEPGQRYASASAMSGDVQRYLEGRPVTARPQSRWYVLSRFLRRNALVSSVVAGSMIALSAATVFAINRAQEAQAEAERSQHTQQILADVFEQADPFGEGGSEVTLADALVRAKPAIKEKVADDPRLAWEVNRTLVGIFTNLDMLELEQEALREAWAAAEALQGDNERERLFAIAGLGNILARTDPEEAIQFLAEHLPSSPGTARGASEWLSAKYAEVSAHIRLRNDSDADQGAQDMAQVARAFDIDAPRTLSRAEQLLAGAARRAGDIDAADEHWSTAIAHMRDADAPLGLAVTLSNYALHLGMTERYAESSEVFQESIGIFRKHETDNTSYANALRLHAGLLFRMSDVDAAQAALDESLTILDPERNSYAYFVAQLNRANFAFASGDIERTYAAVQEGLNVAVAQFGASDDVTMRMLPVLARLLLFSERRDDAIAILTPQVDCAVPLSTDAEIDAEIARLANAPATGAARTAMQSALAKLPADGRVDRAAIDDAMALYRQPADPFIDALDRYRYIETLAVTVASVEGHIGDELGAERERLRSLKLQTRQFLARQAGLQPLIDTLGYGINKDCSSN